MIKILFICNEYPPAKHGGIGVFIKNISEQLVSLYGFECIVVGYYPNLRENQEEIENGVNVIRLKEIAFSWMPFNQLIEPIINRLRLNIFVNKLVTVNKIDIVEAYDWSGPVLIRPRCNYVVRLHGSNSAHSKYENKKISKFLYFFENRTISSADIIVSVSKHISLITHKAFAAINHKEYLIYNYVNTNLFKVMPEVERGKKSILFVGKFHERKGVFELFHILNYLFMFDSEYVFTFVGNHSYENKMELLSIIERKHRTNITFINAVPQDQLPVLYNQSTIMIMPSRAEAFGLTAIEAMACGSVVVMTTKATGPELINDGIDGLLIDSFNYESSALKIHKLLNNPIELNEMSSKAIEKIKLKFSNDVIIEQNYQNYKSMINR